MNKEICGDSLDEMKKIKSNSIDLIITDPPYDLIHHGGGKSHREIFKNIDYISRGFDYKKNFEEFIRISKTQNILIFCSNRQISKTMSFFEKRNLSTTLLIWQKTNAIPFANGKYQSECEFIVYVRGKGSCFNTNVPIQEKRKIITMPFIQSSTRIHNTQKPVELIKKFLKLHSNPNDLILDPFSGSFTTTIACMEMDRDCIGIEIDKDMFLKATKRIGDEKIKIESKKNGRINLKKFF